MYPTAEMPAKDDEMEVGGGVDKMKLRVTIEGTICHRGPCRDGEGQIL